MKILYLAHIRLPTEKAHGAQIMKTCEALAASGNEVELMVPTRNNRLHGEDPFVYYGVKNNFRITECTTPDFIAFGPLGFACSALWFSEQAKLKKQFWEADVIYSRDAFVLLQYALLGRPLVYEAHTKPTLVSLLCAHLAKRIVAISNGLQDAYITANISSEKVSVAHDAIDLTPFYKNFDLLESRKQLNVPTSKKIVLYLGRMDSSKGVDTLASASVLLPEDILVVLIGSGPYIPTPQQENSGLLVLPETPYRDIAKVLSIADVLVIPNTGKEANASRYTSPLKMFAYMASGKPIVASDVPALREVLSEETCFFVSPDNPESLVQGIQAALTKIEEARIRGNRSKEMAENYTWEKRAENIMTVLRLVSGKNMSGQGKRSSTG